LTAGLSAALCAGLLDLFLSLWLEPPAGLASGTTLLLVLGVTFALAFAAFLAGFVLLRLVRGAPLPLALALATLLFLGLLLMGVARSLGAGAALWRQVSLLGGLAVVCAGLVYLAARTFPGLAGRRRLWARISLAAPLLGGAALLALWLARYRLSGTRALPVLGALGAAALILILVSRVRSPQAAGRWLACIAVVALAGPWISAWVGSPGEPAAGTNGAKPKRIILLSIDTLRAGALSCYGEDGARTPHLDRLAADAVRFTHAYSSASWTLPSMASVMTGLSPEVHRAVHSHSRVPDGVLTLAEVLRRSGYRTAALVSSTILGPAANLTQGFDEYTAFPGPWIGHSFGAGVLASLAKPFRSEEAPPPDVADLAAGWLRAHSQGDVFLWVHVFDPHAPYGPPREYLDGSQPPPGATWRFEGWDEDAIRAGTYVPTAAQRDWIHRLYLGEVRYVDDAVGRLTTELQRLGMYDDALIVVLSDHGEEFWEHGTYGHGHSLYDELLHVPLLVKLPGAGQRGVYDPPVTTASVMPTVLALSGLRLADGYPAASPLPLNTGAADRPLFRPLFSLGLNRFEDRKAVRFGRFKYVRWDLTGREELYDLAADPGERHDIAPHEPQGLAQGRELMAFFTEQSRDARRLLRLGEGEEAHLDDGTLARLRALGYVR
jgi:arylsulfatase A-like enzyme